MKLEKLQQQPNNQLAIQQIKQIQNKITKINKKLFKIEEKLKIKTAKILKKLEKTNPLMSTIIAAIIKENKL